MAKKFYVTTTAPYVNAEPHIGFALEIVQADTLARYRRLIGEQVAFGFGTDEHGLKIYKKALENHQTPQQYCDRLVTAWNRLKPALNLSYTNFIRTTDSRHLQAAGEFWRRCLKNGDIYKKTYQSKYCIGCELEKTDSELENGRCPLHPGLNIELINEENYFFRFSKYQKPLLDFYAKNPDFVVPRHRFNEIIEFVKNGLEDFSVSRLKAKMPWGIDVPGDPSHVMYVWFDALIFYISTLGWPAETDFGGYWPGVQVAGKDNLRQQSAIWQALLMSAGLPNTRQILIHGFIQSGGQKMSKSLGNVIDPIFLSEKYGADALRYYLLAKIHPFNDSDFTVSLFEEAYNADLANGLGNLVARIETLAFKNKLNLQESNQSYPANKERVLIELEPFLKDYRFDKALNYIMNWVRSLDHWLDKERPWEKSADEAKRKLAPIILGQEGIHSIKEIAMALESFLPDTAVEISNRFNVRIITKVGKPLFPRL